MRRAMTAIAALAALLVSGTGAHAAPVSAAEARSLESQLVYKTGTITVRDAQITLPAGFRYLESADARIVLEKIFGNPPGSSVLGMIVPPDANPMTAVYVVTVEYRSGGHVSDSDAAATSWSDQLDAIKQSANDANDQRKTDGYPTIEVAGWAEPPHYDQATHKLFWAKDTLVSDSTSHRLSYDVRVLGREGVLDLSAIATMSDLPAVRTGMQAVLGASSFTSGRAYADFKDGDRASELTVAALVAGGAAAAAKTGLIAFLTAKAKLLLLGLIAVVGGGFLWFKRRAGRPSPADSA